MIYKFFGREILANILREVWNQELSEKHAEKIYQKIYGGLIQEVDAIDNGVTLAVDQKYSIVSNLSSRVSRYNKEWNAPPTKDQQLQFKKAMRVVEEELHYHIKGQAVVLLPAYQIVEDAWKSREEFHPSGEFLYFSTPCPWKDHLYEKENEEGKDGLIKFCLYQDERKLVRV